MTETQTTTQAELDFEAWVKEHFQPKCWTGMTNQHAELDTDGRMGRMIHMGSAGLHLIAFRVYDFPEDGEEANPEAGTNDLQNAWSSDELTRNWFDELSNAWGQNAPYETHTFGDQSWVIYAVPAED